ncbi:unnamed protein product [Commensalibacter communis]|nr:unnamed protein product [Commensalibacter communis]
MIQKKRSKKRIAFVFELQFECHIYIKFPFFSLDFDVCPNSQKVEEQRKRKK